MFSTSGLSRASSVSSYLQGTEVRLVQGFGLGSAPSLFSANKGSNFVLGKILLLIRMVFFIS